MSDEPRVGWYGSSTVIGGSDVKVDFKVDIKRDYRDDIRESFPPTPPQTFFLAFMGSRHVR